MRSEVRSDLAEIAVPRRFRAAPRLKQVPLMDDPYSQLAGSFVEHYKTLRGAVRHALVSRQVDAHLSPPPGRIVDVGGGAGHQAIRLARAGHDIVLLDPSPKMLGLAREALAAGPPEVRRRVELVLGDGQSAPDLLGRGSFDGVLCHGVLPYVEDPVPVVRTLAALARPGGLVSVLAKNRDALAMRPAFGGRFEDALAAFEADRDVGGLGVATRGDTVAGLREAFDAAGIDLVHWYGVRLFTDHLGSQPPGPDLDAVIRTEWEAGRRDPYRRVARLIHVFGRRRYDQR